MKTAFTKTHFKKIVIGWVMFCFAFEAQAQNQCGDYLKDEEPFYQLTRNYNDVVNEYLVVPNSWAADLVYLSTARKLMSQTDSKLNDLDLLDPRGGICGPTCVGNIAASYDFHRSKRRSLHWVKNAEIFIDGLIHKYQLIAIANNDPTGINPLLGIHTKYYANEFNDRNKDLGIVGYHVQGKVVELADYYLRKKNAVLVGTVVFFNEATEPQPAHAIIILGIDFKHNQIAIIDPNSPNEILLSAFIKQRGSLYFSLAEKHYGSGELSLVRLDEILSFTGNKKIPEK